MFQKCDNRVNRISEQGDFRLYSRPRYARPNGVAKYFIYRVSDGVLLSEFKTITTARKAFQTV